MPPTPPWRPDAKSGWREEENDGDSLIAAVAEAIEDETERTIGEPSGIGYLLARAAMRAAAEHFERQADQAPDGQSRTLRRLVADQVRPPV